MSILINEWMLLEDENKLKSSTQEVILQPLCVKALALFARHSGEVISRERLLEQVWRGRVVSDDAINNCIKKIRKALGDDPKSPRIIETIPKKGYRLLTKSKSQPVTLRNVRNSRRKGWRKITTGWATAATIAMIALIKTPYWPIQIEIVHLKADMTQAEKLAQLTQIIEPTKGGENALKIDTDRKE